MGLSEVVPGTYKSDIVDWGVREVEALDNAPEAWISFEFIDQAGNPQKITWKGLFLTKAGAVNKKTKKSLEACGFQGDNFITLMDETAGDTLDKTTQVDIQIIDQEAGDKVYKNVEWINKLGESASIGAPVKLVGAQAQTLAQKMARMGLGKVAPKGKATAKPPVRNHAPGATPPKETANDQRSHADDALESPGADDEPSMVDEDGINF